MKITSSIPCLLHRTEHLRNVWYEQHNVWDYDMCRPDDGSQISNCGSALHLSTSHRWLDDIPTCINFKIARTCQIWTCSFIAEAQNGMNTSLMLITWPFCWSHCCRSSGSDKRVKQSSEMLGALFQHTRRLWTPWEINEDAGDLTQDQPLHFFQTCRKWASCMSGLGGCYKKTDKGSWSGCVFPHMTVSLQKLFLFVSE